MESPIILGHTREGCTQPKHSKREWALVRAACAFRCFYCAELLVGDSATKDHLVPLIRSGCDCRGNLVSSCRRCNSMKRDKTVAEFLRMKPGLVETSGKFYTRITLLEPLCDPSNDPLLKEVRRMAYRKAFPDIPNYREPESVSWAWRNPA
jgi:hypothetical protein